MQYISTDQVISSAKTLLRLTDTSDADNMLDLLIQDGARAIGGVDGFVKRRKTIDIIDGEGCLPEDFYRLFGLRVIRNEHPSDPSLPNGYYAGVYVDRAFLYENGCDFDSQMADFTGSFQIVDGKIYFNGNTSADQVLIAYLAYNKAEDGSMMVNEEWERALALFAASQYALSFPEKYTPMQQQSWYRQWIAKQKWCRGRARVREFQNQRLEIMSQVNAIISNRSAMAR